MQTHTHITWTKKSKGTKKQLHKATLWQNWYWLINSLLTENNRIEIQRQWILAPNKMFLHDNACTKFFLESAMLKRRVCHMEMCEKNNP
jgi:hypothetical protein